MGDNLNQHLEYLQEDDRNQITALSVTTTSINRKKNKISPKVLIDQSMDSSPSPTTEYQTQSSNAAKDPEQAPPSPQKT